MCSLCAFPIALVSPAAPDPNLLSETSVEYHIVVGIACVATANCNMNAIFLLKNHTFHGRFLHSFCIFNRKF